MENKRRGRPKGSKNAPKNVPPVDTVESVSEMNAVEKDLVEGLSNFVEDLKNDRPIEVRSALSPRKNAPAEKIEKKESCNASMRRVIGPAGDCPVKLKGTSTEEVVSWAQNVVQKGHAKGTHYENAALRYFVRHFYDIGTSEHKEVCNILKEQQQNIGLAASRSAE